MSLTGISRWSSVAARSVLVAGMATLLVPLGARPASANILVPADAKELAGLLNEAYQQQGICYGWEVTLDDNYNVPSRGGTFTGSNFGAGTSLEEPYSRCVRYVEFKANLTYTSSSSESEDSAYWTVYTNIPDVDSNDLRDHVLIEDSDALVGARDDVVLFRAVASLPLVVAEMGLARPLQPDANIAAPSDTRLTGSPGSDFLRNNGVALLIFGGVLLAGLLWLIVTIANRKRPPPAPTHPPPGPYGATGPQWGPPPGQWPPRPPPGPPPGRPSA